MCPVSELRERNVSGFNSDCCINAVGDPLNSGLHQSRLLRKLPNSCRGHHWSRSCNFSIDQSVLNLCEQQETSHPILNQIRSIKASYLVPSVDIVKLTRFALRQKRIFCRLRCPDVVAWKSSLARSCFFLNDYYANDSDSWTGNLSCRQLQLLSRFAEYDSALCLLQAQLQQICLCLRPAG